MEKLIFHFDSNIAKNYSSEKRLVFLEDDSKDRQKAIKDFLDGMSEEEKREFLEGQNNETNEASDDDPDTNSDERPQLSKEEIARYTTEEQAELAKMGGDPNADIMGVPITLPQLSSYILNERREIQEVLNQEITRRQNLNPDQQAEFIINLLVTRKMEQAGDFSKAEEAILKANDKNKEVSENKIQKRVEKMIHGSYARMPRNTPHHSIGTFARRGGLLTEGLDGTHGLRAKVRDMRAALGQGGENLQERMRNKWRVGLTKGLTNRVELREKIEQYEILINKFEAALKEVRTEILTKLNTNTRHINATFGFINVEADANNVEQDFINGGEICTTNEPNLSALRKRTIIASLMNSDEARSKLMANDSQEFRNWIMGNPTLSIRNPGGATTDIQFNALPREEKWFIRRLNGGHVWAPNDATEYIETVRNLHNLIDYDEVAQFRAGDEKAIYLKMILSLLKVKKNRDIFNGRGEVNGVGLGSSVADRFSNRNEVQRKINEKDRELREIAVQIGTIPPSTTAERAIDQAAIELKQTERNLAEQEKNIREQEAVLGKLVNSINEYNSAQNVIEDVKNNLSTASTKEEKKFLIGQQTDAQKTQRENRVIIGQANTLASTLSAAEIEYATKESLPIPSLRKQIEIDSTTKRYNPGDAQIMKDEANKGNLALEVNLKSSVRSAKKNMGKKDTLHGKNLRESEFNLEELQKQQATLQEKRAKLTEKMREENVSESITFKSPKKALELFYVQRLALDWCTKNGRKHIDEVPLAKMQEFEETEAPKQVENLRQMTEKSSEVPDNLAEALKNFPPAFASKLKQVPGKVWEYMKNTPANEVPVVGHIMRGAKKAGEIVNSGREKGGKVLKFMERVARGVSPQVAYQPA